MKTRGDGAVIPRHEKSGNKRPMSTMFSSDWMASNKNGPPAECDGNGDDVALGGVSEAGRHPAAIGRQTQ